MPHTDPATAPLTVTLPDGRAVRLAAGFYIGRDPSCEIQVADTQVSRRHAEVFRSQGQWGIRDLQSSNGLFVDGRRVSDAWITQAVEVRLGAAGPVLQLNPAGVPVRQAPPPPPPVQPRPQTDEHSESIDEYAQRYFGSDDDESVGGRTLMIRKAFQKVQQQQRRRQRIVIAIVSLVAVAIAGYAFYQHRVIVAQEQRAEAIFYQMKDQELVFARLRQSAAAAGVTPSQQEVAQFLADQRQMESNYEAYAARLYDRNLNEKDRLILRVTRMFGECELAAPPDYIREVKRYIGQWQQTGRFTRAVKRAQDLGYTKTIATTFVAEGLPPQYFYLAMQESNFDAFTVGPPTKWGYAKGMWQFIPETGARYGLKIGPLYQVARADAADERMQWDKATVAAAKYIKDIYSTDAQASGLLVMASYNWGEQRIIDVLRRMPADPRQRNFWKLLANHQVPLQTYNYVFNIVSAAVIGENPRLFGFDFDSPLQTATQ